MAAAAKLPGRAGTVDTSEHDWLEGRGEIHMIETPRAN